MYFHPESYALLQVAYQSVNHPYGDGSVIKKYYDYREFGELRFPTRFESGGVYPSWGTLFNSYEIEEMPNPIILPDLSTFRALTDDYAPAHMVKLAENIYMIQNIGNDKWGIFDYNVLVAAFEDHVLIGEAPVSNKASRQVLQLVESHFPNKPIKYLVQSHHHSDHIAGIREYMARDVELVVPAATQELFRRISIGPWNDQPDAQAEGEREPRFLAVSEPVTLEDALNQAIIVNIGPIPHVNDMLAIYFPRQQLVWQADMITYGEWPLTIEPSVIFRDQLKAFGWKVNTIAGTHGQVLDSEALVDYLND